MKLSTFNFFKIADKCRGNLVGAKGFKPKFVNGAHTLVLVTSKGEELELISNSWDDLTEIANQLNNLLIEG